MGCGVWWGTGAPCEGLRRVTLVRMACRGMGTGVGAKYPPPKRKLISVIPPCARCVAQFRGSSWPSVSVSVVHSRRPPSWHPLLTIRAKIAALSDRLNLPVSHDEPRPSVRAPAACRLSGGGRRQRGGLLRAECSSSPARNGDGHADAPAVRVPVWNCQARAGRPAAAVRQPREF